MDLGSIAERCAGSSPVRRIKMWHRLMVGHRPLAPTMCVRLALPQSMLRDRVMVTHRPHKPETMGSSPVPATLNSRPQLS